MKERRNAGSIQNENTIVSGYASTFTAYLMTEIDNVKYYEKIMPNAFRAADLSDVVFLIDHEGPVLARTKAGSLKVWADANGLAFAADLGNTENARRALEDITAKNYTQMSFSFTVAEDHYDEKTHTRVIDRIKRVFDVSAVKFPQNPGTNISLDQYAQDYYKRAAERERLRLQIKIAKARG